MFAVGRCTFRPSSARFSSNVAGITRQKWKTGASPAPKSIFDDDSLVVDLSEDSNIVDGLSPDTPPIHKRTPSLRPTPKTVLAHRETLKRKYPEGWNPPRKISREAMDGLRDLHRHDPATFNAALLADRFKISPEAVSKILKSKWQPSKERRDKLVEKERQRRTESIRQSRMQEILEEKQILSEKRWHKRGSGGRDTLTFE